MTATRKQSEIQSAAIYRVTDKATKEVFYLVKSDSDAGTWYELHFNHNTIRWECACPSTSPRPCKHEKAVREILRIRRARTAAAIGGDMPLIIATLQAEEDERARLAEARKQPPTPARSFEDWGSCDDATRRGFPGNEQRRQSRAEQERRMAAPLNGNEDFSLLRR